MTPVSSAVCMRRYPAPSSVTASCCCLPKAGPSCSVCCSSVSISTSCAWTKGCLKRTVVCTSQSTGSLTSGAFFFISKCTAAIVARASPRSSCIMLWSLRPYLRHCVHRVCNRSWTHTSMYKDSMSLVTLATETGWFCWNIQRVQEPHFVRIVLYRQARDSNS